MFCIAFAFVLTNGVYAQQLPPDTRARLLRAYKAIQHPEISFEKFAALNSHIYPAPVNTTASVSGTPAPQDAYCSKVRAYCTNGDFESGLDQTQYSGAYGIYAGSLYPDPFKLTHGFLSGAITSSAAHQTVVSKSAGNDPAAGFPLVAPNGGSQSLRLGNAVNGAGAEILAKTITVDANESIVSFYYALVLQDPGHAHNDQPAFSVRAYDCATGLELPDVCNLGNGSNIAVADAGDPFFQSKTYKSEKLVYRDWSLAQINLSSYVGRNVTIVFTTKDCNLAAHFGYAYLDNLFSGLCPVPPMVTNQGSIQPDNARTDSCGTGNICTKYSLPYITTGGDTTLGDITIHVNIYQNSLLVKTISSPKLITQPVDSLYCFSIDPATLGIDPGARGFDYTITASLNLSGFSLPGIIIGNPGTGIKSNIHNDWLLTCISDCNVKATVRVTGENEPAANGAVTIIGSNGIAPYTYILNGFTNTTGAFTGLAAGSYAYRVTDDASCKTSGTVVVNSIAPGGAGGTTVCPADSIITTTPGICTTVINWTVPAKMYPDSIPVAKGAYLPNSMLQLKGVHNGHGYYQSDDSYSWPDAKAAASNLTSHLVTITDSAESAFIKAQLPQPDFGAWIGLYNTGAVGSFAWITGEPLKYTDWNFNEPNNESGTAANINEPYVHIRGAAPNDRWNDLPVAFRLPFIAEFDNPVLTYTQTSGPAPGSTVGAGVYTICYNIKNLATGVTSNCCFTITVVCNGPTAACPKDTVIAATSAGCTTAVKWDLPAAQFPGSIPIAKGAYLLNSMLQLKGVHNGHGYYQSDDSYSWPDAKAAASAVTSHLVTTTDAAESAFIKAQLPQPDFGAWIGLYNTGTVGDFAWITGEPFNYTDWNFNEPNNESGTATSINEPYVHIRGAAPNDRWNDLPAAFRLPFIAEFDNPVFMYTQVSGIPYGSTQGPGVYPICYEISNTITGVKTWCCFNVTVVCNLAPGNGERLTAKSFEAIAYPNPGYSNTDFSIRTKSNNMNEQVNIRVFDMVGRTIEMRSTVQPNSTISIGGSYMPGVYFVQVMQGKKTVSLRLIKQ